MTSLTMSTGAFWRHLDHLGWGGEEKISAYYGDNPPLHFIIRSSIDLNQKMPLLEKALELGADLNQRSRNPSSPTPLMLAARKPNEIELTKWLLNHGADVNALDTEKEAVGFWLIGHGKYHRKETEKLLVLYLDAGLDVTLKNVLGETLLENPDRLLVITKWQHQQLQNALPLASEPPSKPRL